MIEPSALERFAPTADVVASESLVLATFGVYGKTAFMVGTGTREMGIRVALGASRECVLRDVLVEVLKQVVLGSPSACCPRCSGCA